MAFVSEIVAKMGLDTTAFRAALTKTTADVGRAGDDIGRKLNRAFGAGDVFKGLLQGLGIQSIQSVVDKLTNGFKEAADSAKEIEKLTAETANIYEQIFASRRTDEQNIANLRQQDARLLREEKQIRDAAAKERTRVVMTEDLTLREETLPGAGLNEEQSVRLAEIAKQRAQILQQIGKLQQNIDEGESRRIEKLEQDTKRYDEAVKKLADDQSAFERQSMSNEEALRELTIERIDLQAKLADDVAISNDDEIEAKRRILELDKEIAKVNEKIVDDNIRRAEAEVRNQRALEEARKSVLDAEKAADEAFRDRSTFSVAELAAGAPGVSQTTKAKAREIQRLERQARRQRAAGFETEANISTSRALKLRERLEPLSSAERSPLERTAEAVTKANEHLQNIENSLAPSSVQ